MGYKPIALNEAAAIVYSNCAKEQFSALAISCLTPGQKIITKRGFVNIESIEENDKILTKEGLWESCSPTSRFYEGDVLLNPNDQANENQIENKMQNAFKRAYKDNDHDGNSD